MPLTILAVLVGLAVAVAVLVSSRKTDSNSAAINTGGKDQRDPAGDKTPDQP